MPTSAFFAVLRDVTKLASAAADDLASQTVKLASAADDIAGLAGKAAAKSAGVAGDDLAVGASQVSGVSPSRELPALWRIAKASALNKIWLGAILLAIGYFVPTVITVALVLGAMYLSYEGGESLLEYFHTPTAQEPEEVLTEDQKVSGAIKTDIVLSFELLVIALAATGDAPISYKIVTLVMVGALMTVAIYGLIGLLIRLDDMGLALARSASTWKQKFGRGLVKAAPVILKVLGPVGMVAMLAVAGGILAHAVHLEFSHWAVGLLAEISAGAVVGLLLVGLHHLYLKLAGKH